MTQLTGGCLCGKVRYSSKAAPQMTMVCHCKNCQKQAGSSFSIIVGAAEEGFELTGTLKTYEDHGDSGRPVLRKFCPECGSPVITTIPAMPGRVFIKAGTLDDTSWLAPQTHIYCDSMQPWVKLDEATPRFAKNPVRR